MLFRSSGCDPSTSDGTYVRESGGNTQFIDGDTNNFIYKDGPTWFIYDQDAEQNTFYNDQNLNELYWNNENGVSFGSATNTTTNIYDVIATIEDRSASANNLLRDAGYLTLSTNIINGKPAFYFQGERFTGNDIVTAKTIYAVIKTDGSVPSAYAAILEATGGSLYSNVSPNWGSYFNSSFAVNDSLSTNSSYILGTISDDGETYEFRQNGATAKSDTDGNGFYTRSALYFGSDSSDTQAAKCYVAECVIYDRAITNSEAQQLETYLNNKYAIY